MGPDVGDGERLAEDVRPLEVIPLDGRVAGCLCLVGGGKFAGPRLTDGLPVDGAGLLGETRHRRFPLVFGRQTSMTADAAWKRRSRRLLETTNTLERPMEAPAMSGLRSPAAASGRAATL